MNNKLSLLAASWQRPDRFKNMLDSLCESLSSKEDFEILPYIMLNDPYIANYKRILHSHPIRFKIWPTFSNADYESVTHKAEYLAQKVATGDVITGITDDITFSVRHWDIILMNHFREHNALFGNDMSVIYMNNGHDREKCEFYCTTRQWMNFTGHYCNPIFEHFSCDEYVEYIAKKTGRLLWLKDVVFNHIHPRYGKGETDATYLHLRKPDADGHTMSERDHIRFIDTLKERDIIVARIKDTYGPGPYST